MDARREVSLLILKIFTWGLFGVGGILCALNFYLSFLRYPLFRVRGRKAEFRHVSGVPLLGSFLVVVLLIQPETLQIPYWARIAGFALAAIDTGGLHWFIGTLVWHGMKKAVASRHQR